MRTTFENLIEHDRQLLSDSGKQFVVGCDEAGRGCLAGPLTAAAVRLDVNALTSEDCLLLGKLGDSKKLSEKTRNELYPVVRRLASACSIVSFSATWIDVHGIQPANMQAMVKAVERVYTDDSIVVIDGFRLPTDIEHERIIKGDNTSAAIAAASILAKVSRDRMMAAAARKWPAYGFDRHAGYPTPYHKAAIAEHGFTLLHRQSFGSK